MSKRSVPSCAVLYCGIDVSAATLVVAFQAEGTAGFTEREFANSAVGHRRLIAWLGTSGASARVSLEATGIYSLDVALALEAAAGIEVAVLNPRTAHQFAESLRRSKTEPPMRWRWPSTAAGCRS